MEIEGIWEILSTFKDFIEFKGKKITNSRSVLKNFRRVLIV